MNRNDLEQLSSLSDGECDAHHMDALIQQALSSDEAKAQWDTFHLIGDLMRSESFAQRCDDRLTARICAALDQEPIVIAPAALPRPSPARTPSDRTFRTGVFARPLARRAGNWVAAAAAVAFVSWTVGSIGDGERVAGSDIAQVKWNAANDQQAAAHWQEYWMAHQQGNAAALNAGIAPIMRANMTTLKAEPESVPGDKKVSGDEWMRLWDGAFNVGQESKAQ